MTPHIALVVVILMVILAAGGVMGAPVDNTTSGPPATTSGPPATTSAPPATTSAPPATTSTRPNKSEKSDSAPKMNLAIGFDNSDTDSPIAIKVYVNTFFEKIEGDLRDYLKDLDSLATEVDENKYSSGNQFQNKIPLNSEYIGWITERKTEKEHEDQSSPPQKPRSFL